MSASETKIVKIKCPWDDCKQRWQLKIPAIYEDAEAITDEIDGMPGRNENCPKCDHGVFIHYLKVGERRIQAPWGGHRPSPP